MAAFMQFQSLPVALLVAGSSLATATLVGTLVTPWMTGRIALEPTYRHSRPTGTPTFAVGSGRAA